MAQTRKQLEERKNKRDRIAQVLRQPGWKDIEAIIVAEMELATESLLEGDDPTARGALRVLKKISEQISDELEWGDAALKKLTTFVKSDAE